MHRSSGLTRRELLKTAALALPALALPSSATAGTGGLERTVTPRKVIVIGAGLAGLSAAWELTQAGHHVTVLEASNRPGGRVHTLRDPFSDGLTAEAGAMTFSDGFRHFTRYLEAFKIASAPVARAPLAVVHHLRGSRLEVKPGTPPAWPYSLKPDEQGLGSIALVQKYFAAAEKLGDPTAPGWSIEPFKDWDQMTLAGWLKTQGASDEAIVLMGHSLFFGHGWTTGSALHRLISDVALFYMGQGSHVIPGGMDLLPRAFAQALREQIWYGSWVTEMVQEQDRVRVMFRQGGSERTLEAERVICAVPVPLLRAIKITPELPSHKALAIRHLQYSRVTRIYLQARRRFWAEAGNLGRAFTDLPIQLVSEHPVVRAEDAGPRAILECHPKGSIAKILDSKPESERLDFALEHLEKIHPGMRAHFEGGTSYSWGKDFWTGGGYPEWNPGQLTDLVPLFARAEGRIHFAGEHTSMLSRTMEGALESGNRAAREVHAARG